MIYKDEYENLPMYVPPVWEGFTYGAAGINPDKARKMETEVT